MPVFPKLFFSLLLIFIGMSSFCPVNAEEWSFETNHSILKLKSSGILSALIDKRTGKDVLRPKTEQHFGLIYLEKGGPFSVSNRAEYKGNLLKLHFTNKTIVTLRVERFPDYLSFEVVSVETPNNVPFYRMEFARANLSLDYYDLGKSDTFIVTGLVLSIQTDLRENVGFVKYLGGVCFRELNYKGAKMGLLALPRDKIYDVIKGIYEKMQAAAERDPKLMESLPAINKAGGPYATEWEKNFRTYVLSLDPIPPKDVRKWSQFLAPFDVKQISFHKGAIFNSGDFTFNKKAWPRGLKDVKRMTDAFYRQGIICCLHTYSHLITINGKSYADSLGPSPYLSPIPHRDLLDIRQLTLGSDLSADAKMIKTVEKTDKISTVTSPAIWNSRILRIDDELIRFKDVQKNGEGGFLECERGYLGTQASQHKKGAEIHHIGLVFHDHVVPKSLSPLYFEIARNIARTYDEGGFRAIYLDASDAMDYYEPNQDYRWYYISLFVREILRNIKTEPPMMESSLIPGLWGAISRSGACDYPTRGYIEFFNYHLDVTKWSALSRLRPGQFGWFAYYPGLHDSLDAFQFQTLFREDIEYLATKLAAFDYALSLTDATFSGVQPCAYEYAKLVKQYTDLRDRKVLDAKTKNLLGQKNVFFVLTKEKGETPTFRYADYPKHQFYGDHETFTVDNKYKAQRPALRIECFRSTEKYNVKEAQTLIPFDEKVAPPEQITKMFDPPLDLRKSKSFGMGMWIYGDGKGQLVNVRVNSPSYRGLGYLDHYYKVDHKGWRFVPFAEAQNGMYPEVKWPFPDSVKYNKGIYGNYRHYLLYFEIGIVQIGIVGDPSGLRFRDLKALPLIETSIEDPEITIGQETIRFKGSIPNGCYMEYQFDPEVNEAIVKDVRGKILSKMSVQGTLPEMKKGANEISVGFKKGDPAALPSSRWTWKLIGDEI